MILNALKGKRCRFTGTGRMCGTGCLWRTIARIRLVLEQGLPGETYNVGGMCERQNIEVVDRICDLLDELAPCEGGSYQEQKYVRTRTGHDRRYAIDCFEDYVGARVEAGGVVWTGLRKTWRGISITGSGAGILRRGDIRGRGWGRGKRKDEG